MAEPKENDFLDDLAEAEAEAFGEGPSDEELEFDELEAVRAERDEFKDRFMRALADAENAPSALIVTDARQKTMAAQSWRATCCRYMTIWSAPLRPPKVTTKRPRTR